MCHVVPHQCHHVSVSIFKNNVYYNPSNAAQIGTNKSPLEKLTGVTLKWNSSNLVVASVSKRKCCSLRDLADKSCGLSALCSRNALAGVWKFVLYRPGQCRTHFRCLLLISAANVLSTSERKPVVVPHQCTHSAYQARIIFWTQKFQH